MRASHPFIGQAWMVTTLFSPWISLVRTFSRSNTCAEAPSVFAQCACWQSRWWGLASLITRWV